MYKGNFKVLEALLKEDKGYNLKIKTINLNNSMLKELEKILTNCNTRSESRSITFDYLCNGGHYDGRILHSIYIINSKNGSVSLGYMTEDQHNSESYFEKLSHGYEKFTLESTFVSKYENIWE